MNIKLLGQISVYAGKGSGDDAPAELFPDPRPGYLAGTTELDFNQPVTITFDFDKIIADINLN